MNETQHCDKLWSCMGCDVDEEEEKEEKDISSAWFMSNTGIAKRILQGGEKL